MQERLNVRYNVMDISDIRGFAGVKGGLNCGCKDVYFVRLLGEYPALEADVSQMDQMLSEKMKHGHCGYKRISQLPRMVSFEDSSFYADCCRQWRESGKKRFPTKIGVQQEELAAVLGNACNTVSALFQAESAANDSIEKNFLVKLGFWFDWIAEGCFSHWDCRTSIKIVADNITKKQEYLFFYLLTLVGMDVLLLQNREDIEAAWDEKRLSKKWMLGGFGDRKIPAPNPVLEVSHTSCTFSNRHPVQKKEEKTSTKTPENSEKIKIQLPERNLTRNKKNPPPAAAITGSSQRREKTYEELALLAASVVMIAIHDKTGKVIGNGSGIMIGKDGYILTNNHVASGGFFYSVCIEGEDTTYTTNEIVKYNPVLDLAVIQIQKTLHPIPIYRGKEKLVRGQKVIAIGSPLGLFNSVSDGIISGFRMVDNVSMIQFTAPTSPGSSGGALLNLYGEVIGISTAGMMNGQNINLAVGYEDIFLFARGFL